MFTFPHLSTRQSPVIRTDRVPRFLYLKPILNSSIYPSIAEIIWFASISKSDYDLICIFCAVY